MAKYICKRKKIVIGKKGRFRRIRVERCADYGTKGKIKGGLYSGGKVQKRAPKT